MNFGRICSGRKNGRLVQFQSDGDAMKPLEAGLCINNWWCFNCLDDHPIGLRQFLKNMVYKLENIDMSIIQNIYIYIKIYIKIYPKI